VRTLTASYEKYRLLKQSPKKLVPAIDHHADPSDQKRRQLDMAQLKAKIQMQRISMLKLLADLGQWRISDSTAHATSQASARTMFLNASSPTLPKRRAPLLPAISVGTNYGSRRDNK
jgi:hypothetical protein